MLFVNKIQKSGFSLIELLVVIAIIGIISSIGVANLITAQKQARDASRRQIIHNIQTAFEQYYAGLGEYPNTIDGNILVAFDNGDAPTDPKNTGEYTIDYDGHTSQSSYCICAMLEGGIGNADAPSGNTCNWNNSGTGEYYCAQNKQ